MNEGLTKREEEVLRHMLGADSRYSKKQYGFRNHFCSGKSGSDYETLMKLNKKGLVLMGRTPQFADSSDAFFFATEEGCKALGFTKKQIERTFSP